MTGPLPAVVYRSDEEVVARLGSFFLEWADHALMCDDVACFRCREALVEWPDPDLVTPLVL